MAGDGGKDWAREVAKELASHFSFGSGRDSYVTDEQRQNVADNYAAIIVKHCPFKPNVAYMPVPRCETCAHYEKAPFEDGIGQCRNEDLKLAPGERRMVIQEDFGCVQWEAKQCMFTFDVLIDGERKRCGLHDGHDGLHEWKENQ